MRHVEDSIRVSLNGAGLAEMPVIATWLPGRVFDY